MKYFISFLFAFSVSTALSQKINRDDLVKEKNTSTKSTPELKKASISQYQIYTLEKDTTLVDTSLTIKKEYEYNYLRKDIFGLVPFSNEGQTYQILDYGLHSFHPFPEVGYSGKHFNYMRPEDIKYYTVATPFTELYFKTVMEQGQSVDALVSVNTSEQLNFSVAFRGLRSLGKYINQLSSTGNFRFTGSYFTKSKRYILNLHFTGQDFLNGENGGITTLDDFESENPDFDNRARIEVYLRDAKSFLKGKRYFVDHHFRINKTTAANNLYLSHQFYYENKLFEYNQQTLVSTVGNDRVQRFGEAFLNSGINDKSRYNRMYNKIATTYENELLGKFTFFLEDFRFNFFYNKIQFIGSLAIPNALSDEINTFGGSYEYRKNKWKGNFSYSNTFTNQSLSNLDASVQYQVNEKNNVSARFQNLNKMPDHIYNLSQSSFIGYNWFNDFKNQKITNLEFNASTQWVHVSAQLSSLTDYLYFSNDATDAQQQIITPKQYGETINYLSLKASREFKWWKLALDNTILFQQVDQKQDILNLPQWVTRNSLYFSDYFFKKALYLQTGFIFNYYTKHFVNDYNPVIAESFVQNTRQIGDFPMVDFFINARIRQTRIFLKAEHFNAPFTGNNYFTAPNYPYRDFMIRFGLVWNFFQ